MRFAHARRVVRTGMQDSREARHMALTVVLVRHGQAQSMADAPSDEMRTLTPAGAQALEEAFPRSFALLEDKDDVELWSSPAVRAMQTAEIASRVLGVDTIEEHPGLFFQDVDGFLEELGARLNARNEGCIVVVGHVPFMDDVCYELSGDAIVFSTGSVAAIELDAQAFASRGQKAPGKLLWYVRGPKV